MMPNFMSNAPELDVRMASQAGFEPAARCLEGSRSIH